MTLNLIQVIMKKLRPLKNNNEIKPKNDASYTKTKIDNGVTFGSMIPLIDELNNLEKCFNCDFEKSILKCSKCLKDFCGLKCHNSQKHNNNCQ